MLAPVTLCLRYFPQLAACYLVGWVLRVGVIEWAARVGYDDDLWASLSMPLAGMARLGSYVAMFLVIRQGIPALAGLPTRSARQIDIFATVIVPFFAIYLAWQMFREDWLAFEYAAAPYRAGKAMTTVGPTELNPEMLPAGTVTLVIIGAALVARFGLGRLKERMPSWLLPVQVYLDTLWVFLVLTFSASQGVTLLINPSVWLAERRIVVWFNETRESVFSHLQLLESAWNAVMWALSTVLGGAAVPLIWLAVACIVYGATPKADWHAAARRMGGDRAGHWIDRSTPTRTRLGTRWERVPGKVRTEVRDQFTGQIGRFKPVATRHTSLSRVVCSHCRCTCSAISGLPGWTCRAASSGRKSGRAISSAGWDGCSGPHHITFWFGIWDLMGLISQTIIEPLRICLIATTLAWCLGRYAPAAVPATGATESEASHPA